MRHLTKGEFYYESKPSNPIHLERMLYYFEDQMKQNVETDLE